MKRALKWILISVGGVLGLVVLSILAFFAYINIVQMMPKTQEQKDSLEVIKNLNNTPQPETFTDEFGDATPEIYDDRNTDDKATAEEKLTP